MGPFQKNPERFYRFLTLKSDFENQNFTIFKAIFITKHQSTKDFLKPKSAVYHSINLGFDAEVAKNILHGL